MDPAKYLSLGKQTVITPAVLQLVTGIQGSVSAKVERLLNLVSGLKVSRFDINIFRKRTGAQIIEDGYVTGCTDNALAFITLSRAAGIPAIYVETIDLDWLKTGGRSIQGHIYAQIYDQDKKAWIWIDPAGNRSHIQPPKDMVIYQVGLDSWDIGLVDFDSLEKNFRIFRQNWLLNNK